MEKEFVPYEIALQLKELGFNEPCFGRHYYKESYPMLNPQSEETELVFEFGQYIKQTDVTILAPTFSQAFRWFRDKHNLDKVIDSWSKQPMNDEIWDKAYQYYINGEAYHPYFRTHEQAELALIDKLIEILKNK